MILRFTIPSGLWVTGPTQGSCEGRTTFAYKRLQCSMGLVLIMPPQELKSGNYVAMAENIGFTIREDPPGHIIQSLIDTRAYGRLVTIMRTVANRCLRAIRNFGWVHSMHELPRVEDQEDEALLKLWSAEVSSWTSWWKSW